MICCFVVDDVIFVAVAVVAGWSVIFSFKLF